MFEVAGGKGISFAGAETAIGIADASPREGKEAGRGRAEGASRACADVAFTKGKRGLEESDERSEGEVTDEAGSEGTGSR